MVRSGEMLEDDFLNLLDQIGTIYNNFIPKDVNKRNSLAKVWWQVIKECDYKACYQRLIVYSRENQFPPKPIDIYVEPRARDYQLQKNRDLFEGWAKESGSIKNIDILIPEAFRTVEFSEKDKLERIEILKKQAEVLKK